MPQCSQFRHLEFGKNNFSRGINVDRYSIIDCSIMILESQSHSGSTTYDPFELVLHKSCMLIDGCRLYIQTQAKPHLLPSVLSRGEDKKRGSSEEGKIKGGSERREGG